MRAKNGKDFAFTLTIPKNSTTRLKMGPLIQEQFRRAGIRVALESLEPSTVGDKRAGGRFDAILDAFAMHSSQDGMRAAWATSGIGANGANYSSYSNPRFDALLDSALSADPASARERFSLAYAVINDDAPAIWLYEAKKIIGIHRRIQTTPMRPDAWWFGLADWSIPPSGRIPRDRLPPPR